MILRRTVGAALAAVALLGLSAPATARAETAADDALGQCMATAVTPGDQRELGLWIVIGFASHPDVAGSVTVTPAVREANARRVAALLERLLLVDCHDASVAALKAGGADALSDPFSAVTTKAAQSLFGHPSFTASLREVRRYMDEGHYDGLVREAGVR